MTDTIIFDLDGTLLDTLDDLSDSVNYALEHHGLPVRTKAEIRRFLGNGIRNLVLQSAPSGLEDPVFEQVFSTFKSHYMVHCLDKTHPYKGILELLQALSEKGYKMAIVSNKVHDAVSELNQRFFSQYIHVAIGESTGVRRKPAPDTVLAALEKLGSQAEHAVYIGDSEVDYQTSLNAHLPCISVLWGFRDKDFLTALGAKVFAESPQDILTLLPRF